MLNTIQSAPLRCVITTCMHMKMPAEARGRFHVFSIHNALTIHMHMHIKFVCTHMNSLNNRDDASAAQLRPRSAALSAVYWGKFHSRFACGNRWHMMAISAT